MKHRFSILALAVLAGSVTASAQTQVIVSPSSPNGWQIGTFGAGASGAWSSANPRSGNGSASITLANAGTAETDHYTDIAASGLASLTRLQYDWYRASSSTTASNLAPAFALVMQNANATYDYLVYEHAYNAAGAAPTDTWTTEDILNGVFWRTTDETGASAACSTYGQFVTLAQYNTACYGGAGTFVGFDFFMGNSIPGTFEGYVDNVNYSVDASLGTNFNFEADEVATTPEPASLVLLATGLVGVAGVARRRRR